MRSARAVTVDLTDRRRVANALNGVARDLVVQRRVLSQAINRGLQRVSTRWKRQARVWTGANVDKPYAKAARFSFAMPAGAVMAGSLTVRSGHMVITSSYFGARWSRANPGATHKAWGRGQLAVGTFMARGRKPVFRRTGASRLPIEPIWGPSIAREIERHHVEANAVVQEQGAWVGREAARLLGVAVAKARR